MPRYISAYVQMDVGLKCALTVSPDVSGRRAGEAVNNS